MFECTAVKKLIFPHEKRIFIPSQKLSLRNCWKWRIHFIYLCFRFSSKRALVEISPEYFFLSYAATVLSNNSYSVKWNLKLLRMGHAGNHSWHHHGQSSELDKQFVNICEPLHWGVLIHYHACSIYMMIYDDSYCFLNILLQQRQKLIKWLPITTAIR